MERADMDRLKELLSIRERLTLSNLPEYIDAYLERKADRNLALQELDNLIALLQNHILALSLYIKQNYLITQSKKPFHEGDQTYLTKQELANRYRVSIRTINNWLLDGLQCVEIGGVKRISVQAVNEFVKSKRSKKFCWRSTVHPRKPD